MATGRVGFGYGGPNTGETRSCYCGGDADFLILLSETYNISHWQLYEVVEKEKE